MLLCLQGRHAQPAAVASIGLADDAHLHAQPQDCGQVTDGLTPLRRQLQHVFSMFLMLTANKTTALM